MRSPDYSFERQKVEIFRSIAPFRSLPEASLEILASDSEYVELQTGDALFRIGDVDDAIYIVLAGALDMFVEPGDGRRQAVATLGAGDCLGESVTLFHRPRQTSVYASSPSQLAKFSLPLLATLFDRHPDVYDELQRLASRRFLSLDLASSPLLGEVVLDVLRRLDCSANWLFVGSGKTLFQEGDASDYLYIVVSGRLEISVSRSEGKHEIISYIGRGGVVGELDLLTGVRRSATVRAARDSRVVRLSKAQLESLIQHHPQFMGRIVQTVAASFRDTRKAVKARAATVAIVPVDPKGLPAGFVDTLLQELSLIVSRSFDLSSRRIDCDLGPGASSATDIGAQNRLMNWLAEYENEFSCLLLECDPKASSWTALCLGHADLILFVASANGDSSPGPVENAIARGELRTSSARRELVLIHPETTKLPAGTRRWLDSRNVDAHHHIRSGRKADYSRLARFMADKPVGVVLSGGGARGLAHVGALQALQHCGLSIDSIAGTSIGAAVAGQWAKSLDIDALLEIAGDFSRNFAKRFFRDLTFPAVSLNSARRLSAYLKESFADVRIEDLWIPYFCNSSNLTKAEVAIHDEGLLWTSVRASCSIPGIWPPVIRGGSMLVDGGVMNNLPADIMRARCAGSVIAIDVSPTVDLTVSAEAVDALSGWAMLWKRLNPFSEKADMPHIFSILSRTSQLGSIRSGETTRQIADLYVQLPTQAVDFFDWKAAHKLIDLAYAYSRNEFEQWKR